MPAALDVDKQQVRMLVMQYGVRETARQLGIPESTVAAWSARGKWLAEMPKPHQPIAPKVQAIAINPVQALAASMREDAIQGRAAALRAGRKALVRIADLDADELIQPEVANVAHTWGKTHATAAGYAASDSVAKVSLSITAERGAAPPAVVEAEWTDVE